MRTLSRSARVAILGATAFPVTLCGCAMTAASSAEDHSTPEHPGLLTPLHTKEAFRQSMLTNNGHPGDSRWTPARPSGRLDPGRGTMRVAFNPERETQPSLEVRVIDQHGNPLPDGEQITFDRSVQGPGWSMGGFAGATVEHGGVIRVERPRGHDDVKSVRVTFASPQYGAGRLTLNSWPVGPVTLKLEPPWIIRGRVLPIGGNRGAAVKLGDWNPEDPMWQTHALAYSISYADQGNRYQVAALPHSTVNLQWDGQERPMVIRLAGPLTELDLSPDMPVPGAHRSAADAIALAVQFCTQLGWDSSQPRVVALPLDDLLPGASSYWQKTWKVGFAGGAEVEVSDATGVIASARQADPAHHPNTTTNAANFSRDEIIQRATPALLATRQHETLTFAGAVKMNLAIVNGQPTPAIWRVTWQRSLDGIPYRDSEAIVIVQASTGAVSDVYLEFPEPPRASTVVNVTPAQAESTAVQYLENLGTAGPMNQFPWLRAARKLARSVVPTLKLQIVRRNGFFEGQIVRPGAESRVAWDCHFGAHELTYDVFVDAATGMVIGGDSMGPRAGLKTR